MSLYIWAAVIFAVIGAVAAVYFSGRNAGATRVENKVLTKTAEAQQKQLQAATEAPKGKTQVVSRIREKGL